MHDYDLVEALENRDFRAVWDPFGYGGGALEKVYHREGDKPCHGKWPHEFRVLVQFNTGALNAVCTYTKDGTVLRRVPYKNNKRAYNAIALTVAHQGFDI